MRSRPLAERVLSLGLTGPRKHATQQRLHKKSLDPALARPPAFLCDPFVVKNTAQYQRAWTRGYCHKLSLSAHLPVAPNNVLIAAQFYQAARATGVDFIGADADLRAQAELVAIVKPCARVDQDGRRIDGRGEALCRRQVLRHNRVRV